MNGKQRGVSARHEFELGHFFLFPHRRFDCVQCAQLHKYKCCYGKPFISLKLLPRNVRKSLLFSRANTISLVVVEHSACTLFGRV